MKHFIIDGYNYLFRTGLGHDERHRDTLLAQVRTYMQTRHGIRFTVVFDGKNNPLPVPSIDSGRRAGIEVVYTSGETADDWIRRYIGTLNNPAEAVVVSSDKMHITQFTRASGIQTMDCADFKKILLKHPKGAPRRRPADQTDKPEHVKPDDVRYWLDRFGGA